MIRIRNLFSLPKYILFVLIFLTPMTLAAILASNFLYQARNDESFRTYPHQWQAQWITSPQPGGTACYRKTFTVTGPISSAYVVMTASNFYEMRVNNLVPRASFRKNYSRNLIRRQTPYSATGYARGDKIARYYDIRSLLSQGRNVITVYVQSDEPKTGLLLEATITTSTTQQITTDSSWTCSSHQDTVSGVPWSSPAFVDAGWAHAVTQPRIANAPVDGDPAMLQLHQNGDFISTPLTRDDTTVRFRKVFNCPGTVQSGWMRVAWTVPYDLFLNGRLVGSTNMISRYSPSLLGRRNVYEALGRTMIGNSISDATLSRGSNTDFYQFKNILKRGTNVIEVTLHNRNVVEPRPIPALGLDAKMLFDDGTIQSLTADPSWGAIAVGQDTTWHPASVVAVPNTLYDAGTNFKIGGKIDPGYQTYLRIVRNTLLFWVSFLVVGAIVAWGIRRLAARHIAEPGRAVMQSSRRVFLQTVGRLFWPPALVLVLAYCVQTVLSPSTQRDYLSTEDYASLVLEVSLVFGMLSLAVLLFRAAPHRVPHWSSASGAGQSSLNIPVSAMPVSALPERRRGAGWRLPLPITQFASRYGFAGGVALMMILAAPLCLRSLAVDDYLPDEYVSLLAARGIVHTGIPIYENTGIIYTRSVLYHYILALSMLIGGTTSDPFWTRLPAALWQLACLPLTYLFGREVKSRWAGLLATAFVAFSPFLIYFAREARFYSQLAFFTTLAFYLLWRAIHVPGNQWYRVGVALAFSAAYLSQQLVLVAIFPIVLIILLSGQVRLWLRGWTLVSLGLVVLVMAGDAYAYFRWCQTPLTYVDTASVLLFGLHTDFLDLLPVMLLVSNERSQIVMGALFTIGLVYLLLRLFRRPQGDCDIRTQGWVWWNYLYLLSSLCIILIDLCTPRPTNRYTIHFVPLIAVTAACVAEELGYRLWKIMRDAMPTDALVPRLVQTMYVASLLLLCVIAYRPLRVWNNLNRTINSGTSAAPRYVAAHLRPGDKVIAYSPETAMIEMGSCDYFWREIPNSIFIYQAKDGRLRERNSGAILIDSADKLRQAMNDNQRLWVIIPKWQISRPDASVKGLMARLLLNNFRVINEPLGNEVLLWDRSEHHYRTSVIDHGYSQIGF